MPTRRRDDETPQQLLLSQPHTLNTNTDHLISPLLEQLIRKIIDNTFLY